MSCHKDINRLVNVLTEQADIGQTQLIHLLAKREITRYEMGQVCMLRLHLQTLYKFKEAAEVIYQKSSATTKESIPIFLESIDQMVISSSLLMRVGFSMAS